MGRQGERARIRFVLQFVQRDLQIITMLKAFVRILAQATVDDSLQFRGNLRGCGADRLWLLAQDGGQRRHPGLALKCPLAGQHLVEHGPEREDVAADISGFSLGLLRAHVGDGADDGSFVGDGGYGSRGIVWVHRRRIQELRETEIENLDHALFCGHDIPGLQIAMDHTGFMGGGQGVGNLSGIAQSFCGRQAAARDHLGQRLARHVLHDKEVETALLDHVVNDDDVGMIQCGECTGFLQKSLPASRIGCLRGGEELDRDGTIQARVVRFIYHAHAALAEFLEDIVMSELPACHASAHCRTSEIVSFSNCFRGCMLS